ncbi:unnamed protein product, partial [Meganyctiphanes norvegica]
MITVSVVQFYINRPLLGPKNDKGLIPRKKTYLTMIILNDAESPKQKTFNICPVYNKCSLLSYRKSEIMINQEYGFLRVAGTTSGTIIYVAMILACFFVPTFVIKKLKPKFAMTFAMLCYSTYIASQYYPIMGLLAPSSIIVGVAAGILWTSKCTYLNMVGNKYANLTGEKSEVVITRFFGIFFMFFQSTQIWGNLISSLVLSSGLENRTEISEDALGICGANFCPSDLTAANSTNDNLNRPSDEKIYTMVTIFLISGLLAPLIIAIFVDPLSKLNKSDVESPGGKSGLNLLFATFQNWRHPYQLLIIPLTVFSGLEQGFLTADFNSAYISCGLGIHMVGYILICYGICDAVFSLCFSPLVNRIGRVPIFTAGALINLGIIITFLKWMPHPDDIVVFFVIAALWGVADAVWQTQINAMYGIIFPKEAEAAYSNYRLWESVGFAIGFFGGGVFCITTKIITLIVFLIIGILGYYIIEVIEKLGGLKKDEEG